MDPGIRLYYQTEVRDQKGRLVRRSHRRRAHSFVVQYIEHLISALSDADEPTVTDTGGVERTVQRPDTAASAAFLRATAGAGTGDRGIVAGTGSTAVAMGDNALVAQIAEGAGAGQMLHGIVSFSLVGESPTDAQFTISRSLTNNSGGTITITETAIYVVTDDPGLVDRIYMIVRDVLATPDTVLDGQVWTGTYTIRIVV